MKPWFFLMVIPILILLQVTVLDCLKIFDIKPDLTLIGLMLVSLFFDLRYAIFLSAFLGFIKDIFLVNGIGIDVLILPFWSFFIIRLSKKITIDYNYIRAILTFIIGIFNAAVIRLIYYLCGVASIGITTFMRMALWESVYTAVVSFFVFELMSSIISKFNPIRLTKRNLKDSSLLSVGS
ncbi:MAG: rod shape-determining protein MreD [Candidatus Omnitrophica bacterium]|nr:rod shape-determining protein MreD [Candidatus Omnitrophota bacterium]